MLINKISSPYSFINYNLNIPVFNADLKRIDNVGFFLNLIDFFPFISEKHESCVKALNMLFLISFKATLCQ
jgi:hypothetical protein